MQYFHLYKKDKYRNFTQGFEKLLNFKKSTTVTYSSAGNRVCHVTLAQENSVHMTYKTLSSYITFVKLQPGTL